MMDDLDRRLLDEFQRGFPLDPRPYAAIAGRLGCTEGEVLERLSRLKAEGAVARVGATFRPHRVGSSTLAAMAVPEERLEGVAALVDGFEEVNHNYQRAHRLNLWFVVTAPARERVEGVMAAISRATGLEVQEFPLVRAHRLDLGFPLWN
ncbi:AsnC family transcriptional regulator [Azospirillum sp. TSO22-1]|uniref:AsnC family transcriptional regulator n=1 Tax=Azospirillum sp. TSO22-1 TaxID=716789 RepID=UPI001FFE979B|nr:AsnC family transcriptional regulator [Azospirillum sp. TSO22-1]